MDRITVNGIEIAYTATGAGDPVVLIGGSGMPSASWDLSVKPMLVDAGHRVVVFDSRGAGESQAPPPSYTIADMALDTVELIERVVGGPCHVIGLSLGGFVAEEVCFLRPDLVRSVALIACAGRATAFMRAKMRAEEELFDGPHPVSTAYDRIDALSITLPPKTLQDDDATVEQWAELLELAGYESGAGRLGQSAAARDWLFDTERPDRWPDMTVPALIVAFEHDLQFPPGRAREAAEAWPGASFLEIDGVAHGNGIFEAADTIGAALVEFADQAP